MAHDISRLPEQRGSLQRSRQRRHLALQARGPGSGDVHSHCVSLGLGRISQAGTPRPVCPAGSCGHGGHGGWLGSNSQSMQTPFSQLLRRSVRTGKGIQIKVNASQVRMKVCKMQIGATTYNRRRVHKSMDRTPLEKVEPHLFPESF